MKVAIYQPSELLKRIALLTSQFDDPDLEIQSLDDLGKERRVEALLLERGDMSAHDVLLLREKFPLLKILIIYDEYDEFFNKSCITHDVHSLSKQIGEKEILRILQVEWFGLEEATEFQNVVAIHGTHRQVGTTQIALSIGNTLAELNYKVAVLGLNPYNPGELRPYKTKYSLDQVYDLLEGGVIKNGDDLKKYMLEIGKLHYLVGNADFYKSPQFEKEPIEHLIDVAKSYFDVVVLDVGSFYDSFLAITALERSNTHILVATQENLSINEYNRWKKQFLSRFSFHPKNSYMVVNKYASNAIITPKQLEQTHNTNLLAQIPYFPEAADAEYEEGILSRAGYKAYFKVIEGLAKSVANDVMNFKEDKSKSFFGRLKKGRARA